MGACTIHLGLCGFSFIRCRNKRNSARRKGEDLLREMLLKVSSTQETNRKSPPNTNPVISSRMRVDGLNLSEAISLLGSQRGNEDELSQYLLSNVTETE